jgi:asparagine synthase (glutamine-hydrolysing)
MSVQFGKWNFDGKPVDRDYLEKVNAVLAPYGPDGASSYSKENISIVYHAFNTTRESRRESQPHVTASGAVVTWDGRMDNRADLVRQLRDVVTVASTDVAIAAAAYEYWGSDCFAMLIGDWALSIWEPHTRSLTLAKDPIGTRHLYYSFDDNQVTWSTILDPLVLFAGKTFALCEEYIAGWFSFFPAAHLTPYVGIHAVPPFSSVLLRTGKHTVRKYWDFDPGKKIRYRTDAEYEEHFRAVFAEAVRRRLRSDSPILAELSGGMDSSSIVCMADTIIARGDAETPRLDTVSYYDDSEPNWNERPYFTRVEEKRGRSGCHIDVSKREPLNFELNNDRFAAIPGSIERPTEAAERLAEFMTSQGSRVVLSGVGGDEVMGGVPTPILELADLLSRARFRTLAHQLKVWALSQRVPWFHLFFRTARWFFPITLFPVRGNEGAEGWLTSNFARRNRVALQSFQTRLNLFGPLPSFRGNIATLQGLQNQLACEVLPTAPPREKRYPYLDRGLLEFMYSIPREQLVRPGRRRSLMRRGLRDLVPTEILERRRKAYLVRSPVTALQSSHGQIEKLLSDALAVHCGFIDPINLARSTDLITTGKETKQWSLLLKTVLLEYWLRMQTRNLVLQDFPSMPTSSCLRFSGQTRSARAGSPSDSARAEI